MKVKIYIPISISILTLLVGKTTSYSQSRSPAQKSDSIFLLNYQFLDSIDKRAIFRTTQECGNQVVFMEQLTSIRAARDGNYFGEILFSRIDLEKWADYYWRHKIRDMSPVKK
jgi:hypothetical protein